jgi:phospholipase/carboxylesterase
VSALDYRERPSAGAPEGLLVLHHGRGADEHDLLGLADVLDPERRLHVITPGGPLRIPGWPGRHWYAVPRVGYPDPETFAAAYRALSEFHDAAWERTGTTPERTILGGFSMGSVMSYALGLGPDRPAPAGILAFSGFIPTVEGWQPSLADRAGSSRTAAAIRSWTSSSGARPASCSRPAAWTSATTSPTPPTRSIPRTSRRRPTGSARRSSPPPRRHGHIAATRAASTCCAMDDRSPGKLAAEVPARRG